MGGPASTNASGAPAEPAQELLSPAAPDAVLPFGAMAELPTGTVTFLFTDIEGSTRLLDELGRERYQRVQDEHIEILRRAIVEGGGTVVRLEGDGFFAVFPTPTGAVRAAVEAQRNVASHPWPEHALIRVRMGLHTGEGRVGGGDYVGIDVNRAARIAAAGHGGQIVLSEATRALVERDLPGGVRPRSLGAHRLKDIADPEPLFDLVIDGLPSNFPALKTLDARPNNLPPQLTSFVGRRTEIVQTVGLLDEHRLVSLTGPGGTGKTRLALAVGSELLQRFPDGVFVVELASLVDPGQLCPAICEVLGVREEPGTASIDTLVNRLAGSQMLLILDNFEHLLEAGSLLDEVLRRVGEVRVLVTSRTRVGLYGEQEIQVPPLALPAGLVEPEALSRSEAVTLFIDRAREADPRFELTADNAEAVSGICVRLDGLPLAIELAARRIKVLSPQALLARVGGRLDLLATDARNVPERQRTLRATIDWSYTLLDQPQRRLFAAMSVFAGGANLEAIDAVCDPKGSLGVATLDALGSLVDQGLIRKRQTEGGDPRFDMLQTIREYAAERLDEDPLGEEVRARHGAYFFDLAEASERDVVGEDPAGLDRLDLEHDNIQAAFRWALEGGDVDRALRAAAAIWRFWLLRSHLEVGRTWLERLLAMGEGRPETRARGLRAAGSVAYWQNDLEATQSYYGEALEMFREIGDRRGVAQVLYDRAFLPYVRRAGYPESIPQLEEAVELFEEVGDREAADKARDDIPYFRALAGEPEGALPLVEEALTRARERRDTFGLMDHLARVAEVNRMVGRVDRARTALIEALDIVDRHDIEDAGTAFLHLLSSLEVSSGRAEAGMRLYGAAQAIAESAGGGPLPPLDEDPVAAARKMIGEEATDRALAEGRAMTSGQAVAYARTLGADE